MRLLLNVVLIGLALIGVTAIGLFLMSRAENPRSHFANYAELEASELIGKGWLPAFLPKTITDIAEGHSIDTGQAWATFNYDPSDKSTIVQNCQLLAKTPHGEKYACSPLEEQTTIIILRADGTGNLYTQMDEI
jgi:hypothetical protein